MSIERRELSSQQALDLAKEKGWRILIPTNKQLFIDIDTDADLAQFEAAYERMNDFALFGVNGYSITPSKSGNPERKHIIVNLQTPVTLVERIALQAILGSDWKREFHSLRRLQEGDVLPTLFYEK